jgi:hypothetical protein
MLLCIAFTSTSTRLQSTVFRSSTAACIAQWSPICEKSNLPLLGVVNVTYSKMKPELPQLNANDNSSPQGFLAALQSYKMMYQG